MQFHLTFSICQQIEQVLVMRRTLLCFFFAFAACVWAAQVYGQENDESVFWGPENESGIRLGVTLENPKSEFFAGELVRPIFHFRNDKDEAIDFSHPRVVQAVWLKSDAKDEEGRSVDVDTLQEMAWIAGAMSGKLEPGVVGTVYGPMIRIGGSDHGDKEGNYQMVVQGKVDQQLQLAFQLDDFIAAVPSGETGSISFRIVDPVEKINQLMDDIGDWSIGEFSSIRYMDVASALLAIEPEARVRLMKELCGTHRYPMYILCRMLFQPPEGKAIRRPAIGMPEFWSGTMDDWPSEPITIVSGVPFLVTRGYGGTGIPESPRVYLSYCLSKKYEWASSRYYVSRHWQLSHALNELSNSRKWSEDAIAFLESQIELPQDSGPEDIEPEDIRAEDSR